MAVLATIPPNETKVAPYSSKDFEQRRKLRHVEDILKSPHGIQEFLNGDDFDTLTRRFDEIPLQTRRGKRPIKKPRKEDLASVEEYKIRQRKKSPYWIKQSWSWNYDYPYFMNGYMYTLEKNKTIQIMHSVVHEIRYKLIYPQLLRKKYHKSIRYRLGYLFALIRKLQRQQKLVYHELKKMWNLYTNIYITLRLFDKINRLATDIKDVIRLIRQYELLRKSTEDPQYYDSFPSSKIPKWRKMNDEDLKKRKELNLKKINEIKKNIALEKLRRNV